MSKISKTLILILKIFALLVAAVAIFLLSFYFGHDYLFGLRGNDIYFSLSLVNWYERYFPRIPFWYPLQGAGVSLLFGYPSLSHFSISALRRILGMSSMDAFRLLGFFSIPLTSFGIFFLIWSRFKSWTLALLASLFYLLSPAVWSWLYDWGFYSEPISLIFIPWVIYFFDSFLDSSLEGNFDLKTRLSLILASFFLGLTLVIHPISFLTIGSFLVFYGGILTLLKIKKLGWRKSLLTISAIFSIFLMAILFVFAYEINVWHYFSVSGTLRPASRLSYFEHPERYLKPFLALSELTPDDFRFAERNVVLAIPVWSLAILGFVLSLLFERKLFLWGLYALVAFLFIFYPDPIWSLLSRTGAHYYRPFLISLRFILPVLAAFGIWRMVKSLVDILFFWQKRLKSPASDVVSVFKVFIVSGLALYLGWILTFRLGSFQSRGQTARFGPSSIDLRAFSDQFNLFLCQVKEHFRVAPFCSDETLELKFPGILEACQSEPSSFLCQERVGYQKLRSLIDECAIKPPEEQIGFCPVLKIVFGAQMHWSDFWRFNFPQSFPSHPTSEAIVSLPEVKNQRVDLSPNCGGILGLLTAQNQEIGMVNLYAYQASLIHNFWGYQQAFFYGKEHQRKAISELAKYFAIGYVVLNLDLDPIDSYRTNPDWEEVEPDIWRFREAPEKIYSWFEQKPIALVIGSKKKMAYEPLFRVANQGAIGFDKVWLVQGEENVDDYSLKELENFDLLILFGYSYKNQKKAFNLLNQYLKKGGKVFLSTGWQFVDKDWQGENLPEFFPSEELEWTTSLGKTSDFVVKKFEDIDPTQFSPLVWADNPWGVSVPKESLRNWVEPVLKVGEKHLIVVGEYGQGKIAWSGLNLVGHIATYENNPEEIKLFSQIVDWLVGQKGNDVTSAADYTRDFPDIIGFEFKKESDKSALLFREAFHPDWRAVITEGTEGKQRAQRKKLKIYRAGPGLMLLLLPKISSGDKLVLNYSPGWRGKFGIVVSTVAFFLAIILIIWGDRLKFGWRLVRQLKINKKILTWWERDEG